MDNATDKIYFTLATSAELFVSTGYAGENYVYKKTHIVNSWDCGGNRDMHFNKSFWNENCVRSVRNKSLEFKIVRECRLCN